MNSTQIENVLQLIDGDIALTRNEATLYLRSHREEVAKSLAESGSAQIPTSAGSITLTIDDLQSTAA